MIRQLYTTLPRRISTISYSSLSNTRPVIPPTNLSPTTRSYRVEVPSPPLSARNYDERLARNATNAYQNLQNMMKSGRVAGNIKRHQFYEKPKVRRVRLDELKVRKRSFMKLQKLTEWVEWRRGDGPGMKVRQTANREREKLTKEDGE